MPLKPCTLWLYLFAFGANAHELDVAARGLAVRVEHLEGDTALNGLPVTVSRATGAAVPQLVDRVLILWREQVGADSVKTLECCGWKIASRIHEGRSQVVQWRLGPAGSELILSSANLLHPAQPLAKPSLEPVTGCHWSAPVQGSFADRHYLQLTALCSRSSAEIIRLLGNALSREGWTWRKLGASLVQADRGGIQQQWTASEFHVPGGWSSARSTLVLVETGPAVRRPP